MSHVLPIISRGRFFEPIFTSKKFDLYTSIYNRFAAKVTLTSREKRTVVCASDILARSLSLPFDFVLV